MDETPRTPSDDAPGADSASPADDAFARLRAADPASGATTDLDSLDAAVRARIDATVTELPARTTRRPARWLQLAAVVAGVAVIGGGAFAIGRETRPAAGSAAAPAIALGNAPARTAEGAVSGAGRSTMSGAATDSAKVGYGGSRTVFTSSGLSGAGGTAEAWAFDAASVFSQETAARAATALGLPGTPTLVDGAWTIGSYDGAHPTLQLQPDATASLSYDDPTKNPYVCGGADTGSSSGAEATPGVAGDAVAPPTKECTEPKGTAPAHDAAIDTAKQLLTAFGLDAAAYEFETSDTGTPALTSVTGWQVVAGQRTGQATNVNLTSDGVQSVWAQLAPVVSLGSYPVVSETDAVARLGDARFGSSYGGVIAMDAGSVRTGVAPDATSAGPTTSSTLQAPAVQTPTVPAVPSAGAVFAWPVQQVTLTKARLGVTVYTQPDGSAVLLPAYELSDADGQSWSVLAVADGSLDFAPVG